jgi:hypothetical protein
MRTLMFSLDDLALNRAGQISSEQRLRLGSESWFTTLGYSILALVLAILAVDPALRVTQTDPTLRDTKDVLLMILFAGLALIPATLAFRRWRKVMADTMSSKVNSVRGEVVIEKQSTTTDKRVIKIKDLAFSVNVSVVGAFSEGLEYIVYFVPNTMTILSAEMLFAPS